MHTTKNRTNPIRITFSSVDSRDFVMRNTPKFGGELNCEIVIPAFLSRMAAALSRKAYNLRQEEDYKTQLRLDDGNKSLLLYVKRKNEPGAVWHVYKTEEQFNNVA